MIRCFHIDLRPHGSGREGLGAKSQKVSKKVSKKSPGAGSEESLKKVQKVKKKNQFQSFFWLFGPFSRLFFGLLGPDPGDFFEALLETWLLALRLPLPGPRNLKHWWHPVQGVPVWFGSASVCAWNLRRVKLTPDPDTFEKYRDTPSISIAILLLQEYALLLAESSEYTPPIYITIRLPCVSRYFCRSIQVRGRCNIPILLGP